MTLPPVLSAFTRSASQLLKRLATVPPREPKSAIGIDIGSSSVKIVVLGPGKSAGLLPLVVHHELPLEDASDAGIIAALKRAVSELRLPARTVTCAVSGQSVIMRVVEMPKLAPNELAQALPFEAQRHLPFNLEDVILDGAVLGPAEGNKVWVLMVACKRDVLNQRITCLNEAELEPAAMDVDGLALANAVTDHHAGQEVAGTCALVNVGAQWTNLVVLKDGIPYLVRDIPWGVTKLAHDMAEQLGRDEAALCTALRAAPLAPELAEPMNAACESLTSDLQLSFDYFESRFGTSPDRLILTGGFCGSAAFLGSLKHYFVQPMSVWTPRADLGGQFAVAYGLALHPLV